MKVKIDRLSYDYWFMFEDWLNDRWLNWNNWDHEDLQEEFEEEKKNWFIFE